MKNQDKTNAMRILEQAGIKYGALYYDISDIEFSGQAAAAAIGVNEDSCLKTLTARNDKGNVRLYLVPVSRELDLKKAAAASRDKRVELVPVKDLLQLTGYMRGSVSPIGMKKKFPAYIDKTAMEFEEISVSAGKKGSSLLLSPAELCRFVNGEFAELS